MCIKFICKLKKSNLNIIYNVMMKMRSKIFSSGDFVSINMILRSQCFKCEADIFLECSFTDSVTTTYLILKFHFIEKRKLSFILRRFINHRLNIPDVPNYASHHLLKDNNIYIKFKRLVVLVTTSLQVQI